MREFNLYFVKPERIGGMTRTQIYIMEMYLREKATILWNGMEKFETLHGRLVINKKGTK